MNKDDIKNKLNEYYASCLMPLYKNGYLTSGNDQNSESEGYALLQSYWAGNGDAFAKVLSWTNANLKHSDDNLFAWKFDVSGHVTVLDQNSATDADTDIAYALLMAGSQWKNQSYIDEGRQVAASIWDRETTEIGGTRYLLAGAWANQTDRLVVNPSYYSPQAYRTFAIFDTTHDWNKLVNDSYVLLSKASAFLGTDPPLVPNWVQIEKPSGSFVKYEDKPQASDFGYDAFRTLWRASFDQLRTPSFAASGYLYSIKNFDDDWKKNQSVCALYIYQNNVFTCDTSTSGTLAAPLALFSVTDQVAALQLVQKYYLRDGKLMFPDKDFYARSWHWFGLWLWSHS